MRPMRRCLSSGPPPAFSLRRCAPAPSRREQNSAPQKQTKMRPPPGEGSAGVPAWGPLREGAPPQAVGENAGGSQTTTHERIRPLPEGAKFCAAETNEDAAPSGRRQRRRPGMGPPPGEGSAGIPAWGPLREGVAQASQRGALARGMGLRRRRWGRPRAEAKQHRVNASGSCRRERFLAARHPERRTWFRSASGLTPYAEP